jgi:hypothetical protein
MNILTELSTLLTDLGIPFETGHYSGTPPDEYIVIVPISDQFSLYADNEPQIETQEASLSIFSKENFMKLRNRLAKALLAADFTITDRRYVGFESDTLYHHHITYVEKSYEWEG